MLKIAREDLARSGITPEEAEEAGIYAVKDCRAECGPAFKPLPAIVIPYLDPQGDFIQYQDDRGKPREFFRVRYLGDSGVKGWAGKSQRYAQPPRSGVHPYFPQLNDLDWSEVLADASQPLIITEGEKKALRACLSGFNCIGLGGVYNFLRQEELLPLLDQAPYESRLVYVCYDSDSADNKDIQAAEGRLAGELVKRGARVRIVRLPELELDNGDTAKQGLDDFLEREGDAAFQEVLKDARWRGKLGKVEQAVLRMNQDVAWIASTSSLYDLRYNQHLAKDAFVTGSDFAAESVEVAAPRSQDGKKKIYIAGQFLKSPLARRYRDVVCDPSTTEREVWRESPVRGWAYNTFEGLRSEPGDVSDFLMLTDYLFSDFNEPDFGLKFFAYKAQNLAEKIPIGFLLVSPKTGAGKSLWGKVLSKAFAPYTHEADGARLVSQYNEWLENKLLVVWDEAEPNAVKHGADTLKKYISEREFPCEQKFIPTRQAMNLATFILTSNKLETATFDADDRRMCVVTPPNPVFRPIADPDCYSRLYEICNSPARGGEYGAHVLHYLQNYDLEGWKPPRRPPADELKRIALKDSLSTAEQVASAIVHGEYKRDPVLDWCDMAMAWARENMDSPVQAFRVQAREVLDTLPHLRVRPWYTPEELLNLLPHLQEDVKIRRAEVNPAAKLSALWRQQGVDFVKLINKRRPLYRGQETTFLHITNDPQWHVGLTQAMFDEVMQSSPRYGDLKSGDLS